MTKTRRQVALDNEQAKLGRQAPVAPAVHKITKGAKNETPSKDVISKKTPTGKVNGGKTSKAKSQKEDPKKKELVYSDMVKQEMIKKFDINEVLDQTGNSNGDCHLPRATLNEIIKKSLPQDVRAQKETMDLICFISNAFVDLLSDVSNNVCYQSKKKNIIPEHVLKALQELHMDAYLPFLIGDDMPNNMQEILRAEKKKPKGLHVTMKQALNEDQNANTRSVMINTMLQKFVDGNCLSGDTQKRKRQNFKFLMNADYARKQQEILRNVGLEDSDDGLCDPSSNESPSFNQISGNETPMDAAAQAQAEHENVLYWAEYKNNWINHNQPVLDQEYEGWVKQNVEYNITLNDPNMITDAATFQQTYTKDYFYDMQYNQYIQVTFPQQPDQNGTIAVQNDATATDTAAVAQEEVAEQEQEQIQPAQSQKTAKAVEAQDEGDVDFDDE